MSSARAGANATHAPAATLAANVSGNVNDFAVATLDIGARDDTPKTASSSSSALAGGGGGVEASVAVSGGAASPVR